MFHVVDVAVVVYHDVYRDAVVVVVADGDAVHHVSFVHCGRCCCSIRQSRGRCCWRNTEIV